MPKSSRSRRDAVKPSRGGRVRRGRVSTGTAGRARAAIPTGRARGLQVEVFSDQAGVDVATVRWLQRQLTRIAKLAGVRRGALSVAIVDDTQMARLHRRYLNLPGTTDALSFDLRDEQAGAEVQGELVLCFDEAVRQARRRGHEARLELLLYAVHGLLHLLGYDDRDPRAAAAMHRREDELLTVVGVGPVFHLGKSRR